MIIEPGDEKRAAERIVRLVKRYALRFDPPDQAKFYARLVRGLAVPMKSVTEFIHWTILQHRRSHRNGPDFRSVEHGGTARETSVRSAG